MLDYLGRDIRSVLFEYLDLKSKRALLCVSKIMYWWIKPHLCIKVAPYQIEERYCMYCPAHGRGGKRIRLGSHPSIKAGNVLKDNNHFVECEYGHRNVCHGSDIHRVKPGQKCPRAGCEFNLVYHQRRVIRVTKRKITEIN